MTPHRDMKPASEPPARHPRYVHTMPWISTFEYMWIMTALGGFGWALDRYGSLPDWAIMLFGGALAWPAANIAKRSVRKTWDE